MTGAACQGANCLPSSPATLPSITPASPGELLTAGFITDQGAQGTGNPPWSTDTGTNISGSYYILISSAGSTLTYFPETSFPTRRPYSSGRILAVLPTHQSLSPPLELRTPEAALVHRSS